MRRAAWLLAVVLWAGAVSTAWSAGRLLTPADAIGTTRFQRGDGHAVTVSPDGRRYAAMLITGDVKADGNWLEIVTGSLDSFDAAQRVEKVARLFFDGLGEPDNPFYLNVIQSERSSLRWLDNERVAFFWVDGKRVTQAFAVNLRTRAVTQLTQSSTNILPFVLGLSGDGSTVLYTARPPVSDAKAKQALHDGFVVTNDDAFAAIAGRADGESELARAWNVDWYLQSQGGSPVRLSVSGAAHVPATAWTAEISPDARMAIVDDAPRQVPAAWRAYTSPILRAMVVEWLDVSPDAFVARQLKALYVVDLTTRKARPLWNAPALFNSAVAWSPDGRAVLLAPTIMPTDGADTAGLAGTAAVVVDIASGAFARVPITFDPGSIEKPKARWLADNRIVIETKAKTRAFEKQGAAWHEVDVAANAAQADAPVRVAVRSDLNTPPRLYAIDAATKREQMIFDPNPRLASDFALGRVETMTWTDSGGRDWKGVLYYPANYRSGRHYPLVVQTHGAFSYDEFSLYGQGGDLATGTGIYAAQLLAGRGIAVVQVEDQAAPQDQEAEIHMRGYEAAARHLAERGVVDADRVGIMGFSRTGWYVQYALTHSDFPYAAAITADNVSGGYVESTLAGAGFMEVENGGPPFGDKLAAWLAKAPPFGTDRIRTPLRLVLQSGPVSRVLSNWEMFSRLRRLNKPVELYVMPDVEHGAHTPQNPRQLLALQDGAVDWFDFWLNGREDASPAKAGQYSRWRKLRALRSSGGG